MGAVLAFRQIVEDLTELEAPAPVIALAQRAVEDERKHGQWGGEWARFFGHPDASVPEPSRTRKLMFPGASARENRVLRIVFCCMTETVGCHLLRDIRPQLTYPALRELNRLHLADELQHARVGWAHLSTLDARDRALVEDWLPELSKLVIAACCEGPEQDYERLVPYGYLTPRLLFSAYDHALDEVLRPGLSHLGIREAA
jgi:hypothetical protein